MKACSETNCHLLPYLLGAAEWESSGEGGVADGDHYGAAVGGAEVWVHSGAAVVELCGNLRAFRFVREHDVLGISNRVTSAGGSEFERRRTFAAGMVEG